MEQVSIALGANTLSIECGKMAKQADGSAYVRYGDTVVLATACSTVPREGIDFFPLTVDYREYTYAAGRIPGGFFKREGRPTEKEILTSRLIDRPIRPLFPEGFKDETQVIALVLSADTDNNPDVVGLVAGAAALYLSDIPFFAPVAAVRVGLVDGRLTTNPTYSEIKNSLLNLIVAGTEDAIVMVEAGAKEVSEATIIDAIQYAHGEIRKIVAVEKELFAKLGLKKREYTAPARDEALFAEVRGKIEEPLHDAMDTSKYVKLESHRKIAELRKALVESYPEEDAGKRKLVAHYFDELEERLFRDDVVLKRQRPDKRAFDQVRAISSEVGILPRTHGSALFTRGETQALVTATLGTAEDQQRLDVLEGEAFKRFMLHYNFPPFSVGEVAFLRGPGPPRDRTRRSGRTRAAQHAAGRDRFPLHRTRGLRHPGIQRFLFDGDGLRRDAGPDGRRRSGEGSGGGHRHGPGEGRREVRHPHGYRGRRRSLRRHGLQGCRDQGRHHRACRWISRSPASLRRSWRRP